MAPSQLSARLGRRQRLKIDATIGLSVSAMITFMQKPTMNRRAPRPNSARLCTRPFSSSAICAYRTIGPAISCENIAL